jgi:hypothetical protein
LSLYRSRPRINDFLIFFCVFKLKKTTELSVFYFIFEKKPSSQESRNASLSSVVVGQKQQLKKLCSQNENKNQALPTKIKHQS